MLTKNHLHLFAKWWLERCNLPQQDSNKQLAHLITGGDPNNYIAYLLDDIFQISNILRYPSEADQLYEGIHNYFLQTSQKKKHQELQVMLQITNDFTKREQFEFPYIVVLWTISILKVCSKHTKLHWYQLELTDEINQHIEKSRTLIELVSDIVDELELQYQVLYCLGHIASLPNQLTLQKYVHIIIRKLSHEHTNGYISVSNKYISEITFNDTKNMIPSILKKGVNSGGEGTDYKKLLAVVIIKLDLVPPQITYYNLYPEPAHYCYRENTHLLLGQLPMFANNLLHQKTNKPHTKINYEFYRSIEGLLTTKFFLDWEMIEHINKLVLAEFRGFQEKIATNLSKNLSLIEGEVNNSPDLKLKQLFKKLLVHFKVNSVRLKTYKYAYTFGKKTHVLTNDTLFKTTAPEYNSAVAGDLALFLLKFNMIKFYDVYLVNNLGELQECLTKLFIIKDYFKYIELLKKLNLPYVHFSIFSDFRGRIYYHSPASPQGYWYFRFLYHFGVVDIQTIGRTPSPIAEQVRGGLPELRNHSNLEIELYLAIGVLFKTSCAEKDGRIFLKNLVQKGMEVHTNPATAERTLNNKELAELLYYRDTLTKLQSNTPHIPLRYIFKDTTCSMTQHAGKLLGYKVEALPYLNLKNSDYSYDTYAVYINSLKTFLQRTPPLNWDPKLDQYITRAAFKNLIMTVEYGVTEQTAYQEYCAYWQAQANINAVERQKLLLKSTFRIFFSFFREGIVNMSLFNSTRNLWTDSLIQGNEMYFTLPDLTMHNFYYFKDNHVTFYENFNKKDLTTNAPDKSRERHSLSLQYHIDLNLEFYGRKRRGGQLLSVAKTRTAAYVNAIHSLDAYYLRRVTYHCRLNSIPIVTIHDGFGVPFTMTGRLLTIANIAFCESVTPENHFLAKNTLLWEFSTSIVI